MWQTDQHQYLRFPKQIFQLYICHYVWFYFVFNIHFQFSLSRLKIRTIPLTFLLANSALYHLMQTQHFVKIMISYSRSLILESSVFRSQHKEYTDSISWLTLVQDIFTTHGSPPKLNFKPHLFVCSYCCICFGLLFRLPTNDACVSFVSLSKVHKSEHCATAAWKI